MSSHYSVLLNEAINLLDIQENKIYVDGTLGRAGHSSKILENNVNHLYCFDLDRQAISESQNKLRDYQNVTIIHDNFKNMFNYVDSVDGILLDLGVSSPQFDESERGFSYRFDGPLDMRMNKEQKLTCKEVVNTYSKEELTRILKEYGEEKYAYKIASAIEKARSLSPLETTFQLVDVIKNAIPKKELTKKGHPCKQSFQAFRIEVNQELDSLKSFLNEFENHLNIGGKVAIITFHSLEDKLVKAKFKSLSTVEFDKYTFIRPEDVKEANFRLLNHKVIQASENEIAINPRSKSAKLRVIERLK